MFFTISHEVLVTALEIRNDGVMEMVSALGNKPTPFRTISK